MNREEILAKSREENKNQDLVKEETSKKASIVATIVVSVMAAIYFVAGIVLQGIFNYGFISIAAAINAVLNLFDGVKLKKKTSIVAGCIWLVLAVVAAVSYFCFLVKTSTIL